MAELGARERLKRDCARAALERILPAFGRQTIVGVGTGSTANHFIDALAEVKRSFAATIASRIRRNDRVFESAASGASAPVQASIR